jgi:hypothetical protein
MRDHRQLRLISGLASRSTLKPPRHDDVVRWRKFYGAREFESRDRACCDGRARRANDARARETRRTLEARTNLRSNYDSARCLGFLVHGKPKRPQLLLNPIPATSVAGCVTIHSCGKSVFPMKLAIAAETVID